MIGRCENRSIADDPRREHLLMMSHTASILLDLCQLKTTIGQADKVRGQIIAHGAHLLGSDPGDVFLSDCHDAVFKHFLVEPLIFGGVLLDKGHSLAVARHLLTSLVEGFAKFVASYNVFGFQSFLDHLVSI